MIYLDGCDNQYCTFKGISAHKNICSIKLVSSNIVLWLLTTYIPGNVHMVCLLRSGSLHDCFTCNGTFLHLHQCEWSNPEDLGQIHYSDVIMDAVASQITSLTIVCSGTDERKHQSSTSLAFVLGIHRWPVNSPHKWPVTRKRFPFDDVIMRAWWNSWYNYSKTLYNNI